MSLPIIHTALPRRRYQYGEFSLVMLGDIESGDGVPYHFLMGIIPDGKSQPELFISAEKVGRREEAEGAYRMRLIAEKVSQTLGHADHWGEEEDFARDALNLAAELLQLPDEEPMRMM